MKKLGLLLVLGLLMVSMLAPGALASRSDPGPLEEIWFGILDAGSLKFLFGNNADNQFIGFIRIAYAVIVGVLLSAGLMFVPIAQNFRTIIAVILSIITAVFTPASLLVTFGETYAVIFALLIVFGPILGVGAILVATPTPNRAVAALKLIVVLFLMYLINQITHWGLEVANAVRI